MSDKTDSYRVALEEIGAVDTYDADTCQAITIYARSAIDATDEEMHTMMLRAGITEEQIAATLGRSIDEIREDLEAARREDERIDAELRRQKPLEGIPLEQTKESKVRLGLLVDHPKIEPAHGPAGWRASLRAAPLDIWEVVTTWRDNDSDIAETAEYLRIAPELVEAALAYYRDFPNEIDSEITLRALHSLTEEQNDKRLEEFAHAEAYGHDPLQAEMVQQPTHLFLVTNAWMEKLLVRASDAQQAAALANDHLKRAGGLQADLDRAVHPSDAQQLPPAQGEPGVVSG